MKWTASASSIPNRQLSERKLLQVSIIPNVETQFETGDKVSLLEFLPENTIVWLKELGCDLKKR